MNDIVLFLLIFVAIYSLYDTMMAIVGWGFYDPWPTRLLRALHLNFLERSQQEKEDE